MNLRSPLLSFLLSSLVVTWGICTPALRHAHEGGKDASHRHVAAGEQHDHGHDHGHDHHHPDPAEVFRHRSRVDASTMGECAVHLHWVLFGIDFVLPGPTDSHAPDHLPSFELVTVRLVRDLPTLNQEVEQRCADADLAASRESVPSFLGLMLSTQGRMNPIASLPLCDRARFERSGVLLA